MTLRVCLAGATGWAGSALAREIAEVDDVTLAAAVSRTHAGRVLGEVLDEPRLTCRVYATAEAALAAELCNVFVEYTKPDSAREHVLAALAHGAHVVVGTSGLTEEDFAQIAAAAEEAGRGVLACGNFALTVVLLQRFAEMAAQYVEQWEIIDYAGAGKVDAPSGTARELAHRLSQVRRPEMTVPLDEVAGPVETRGATLDGSQVHSVRLPGYTISLDVIFGLPDQKLVLRHEAGSSAQPYVAGALLAIREVSGLVGLHRGLDTVMAL
ncbi:MAG TPA: 4-hydroxy-tetrahydrodipicolinate reductase [Candidatus Sulfomarinibacteraceae bacterium]|nr:4-hydroxy-tetrahydrodipicolinate reductase [Candidatus Sulfomarinibacteraceae bacterium]